MPRFWSLVGLQQLLWPYNPILERQTNCSSRRRGLRLTQWELVLPSASPLPFSPSLAPKHACLDPLDRSLVSCSCFSFAICKYIYKSAFTCLTSVLLFTESEHGRHHSRSHNPFSGLLNGGALARDSPLQAGSSFSRQGPTG